MKKLLFILITLFLPILAVANNSGKCGDGVSYIIEESTGILTISKTSEGTGEMDNYYTYSTHAPWCNSNYQYLIKKVVIDDGVISIGRNSFSYLYNLASIEIPNSVRSIGEGAFYETAWYNQQPDGLVYGGKVAYKYKGVMPEYTQIEIAEGTLGISENAFSNCNGLVSLTIPEGVISIGSYAFYGCSNLSTLNIPNSISHIGISLFEGTPWYENLPNGLTYIGKIAFKYNGAMPQNTKIEIKEGTVEIYECAFINCSGLTSVTIPDGVTNIGFSAFNGCCNLKSVVIPNSVTSIGIQAFAGCSALSSITFPSGITSVGNEAFYGTTWLNNQPDGLVYIGKVAYKYKGSSAANTNVVIKEGIIGISSNAFYDCGSLSSVTIPNSVIRIEDRAFLGCNGMTSINIPNSVTFIGSAAFHGCSSLTSITIPYSVTSIGDYAFEDCSNLSLVTILAPSLDYYGESVFANNATGRIVYVPSANVSTYKNKWSKISNYIYYLGENSGSCGENVTYSYEESTGLLLISGEGRMSDFGYYVQTPWKSFSSSIKNVIIETGVTSIGDNAFTDCSSLSTITVPISVDNISEGALSGTEWFENQPDGLVYAGKVAYKYKGSAPDNTEIVIKDGTLSITASAFYDCKGISSVSIPNSVAAIGKSAFYGCSDLVSMTIPNNVSFINDNTFNGCCSLISISLPSALTSIGYSAFFGCVNLTSLNIPSSVTRIEHDAFNSCSALKTINLPFNVTSIAKHTFAGCSGLTSIEIPESITSIGENAFSGCCSLSVIVIPESVISIDDYAFANCSGLITAKLPNNNNFQYIRRGLFKECTSLSSVNIPNRVETIYDYAFQGCSALASLDIPSSVASIGYQVFEGCCNLKSIVVDKDNSVYDSRNNCNAIISIGTNELKYGCNGTIIPEDVTSIASFAFSGCNNLISIRIPSSVTNISDNSFVDCNGISSIIVDKANAIYDSREDCNAIIETATNRLILASMNTIIPEGVEMNSQIAYKNCVSLSLPEGLESISSSMFENCKHLESITIPGSVKTIESGAFYNCTSLKNVKFEVGVDPVTFQAYSYYYINWFANCPIEYINIGRNIKYEIVYNNSGNNSLSPFKEKETLTKVDFSDNVSIVSDGMFSGCNNLEIVQLPERMEYIGNSAFNGCSSLVSISLPNGLKNICSSAFSGCKKVSSFIIPNSVESIGESAFYGCEALTSVSIPNSVTYIDRSAFMSCISLSELVFEDGNEPLSIRELSYSTAFSGCPISTVYLGRNIINDSYNYIYSSLASFLTPFDLTISKNVTTISGGTFANCERIKTLTFEEGTDELILVNDHNAYNSIMPFANTPIDSIYLGRVIVGTDKYYPESTIKPFACVGSSFSMRIGENIAAIGERAYSEWKIESLYIPDNVSQIGVDAFNDCTSLAFVMIEDGNTPLEFLEGTGFYHCPLKDLYVGRNLTYDSWKSPFRYNKEGLKNLAIGNQVTEIAMNEFVGLKSVTSLQFPTSLTKIGYQAFYGCEALTTISVPNCITTIEEDAFGLCRGLTSFIIEDGAENLSINNNFLNSPLSEVYIGRNITYPGGNSPFSLLESLQLLKIGKQVELIGDRAFLGCQNLTDVFSYADNVPTTGQYVFTESYLPDATLHIPASAFNAYRVRYPWNLFRNFAVIEENGDEYLVTITPGDANGDGVVNAADIVEVVNAKNGNPSANYNAINADMDGSEEVNQTDINAIVDIIMKQ